MEQHIRDFFEEAPIALAIFNEGLILTEVNRAGLKLMPGKSKRSMVGKHITELSPGVESSGRLEKYKEVMRSGVSFEIRDFVHRPAGSSASYDVKAFRAGSSLGLIVIDATAWKNAEDNLKQALREKEALTKELHHRVKNNMQVVDSLFSLYSGRISDPGITAALNECKNYIHSLALANECLLHEQTLAVLDLGEYVHKLCDHFRVNETALRPKRRVAIKEHLDSIAIPASCAVSCGLILSELISNACEHAFTGRKEGLITVSATRQSNTVTMSVSDNGRGMPKNLCIEDAGTFGLELIRMLAEQIDGCIKTESGIRGTTFRLIFNAAEPAHDS